MWSHVCTNSALAKQSTMLLLWPWNWELEDAVKKRCEDITSFLETRPDPEARPQLPASVRRVQWVGPGQAVLRSPN